MVCEPSNGTAADISALLRASRIRRGEGLRDVAGQLRIRFVHLEAIEDGRFDELPGNTYAIGFIRTYAEHLGLDGEEIVRRFKSMERGSSDNADLVFPSIIPEHSVPGGAIVMLGLLVAVVGYGSWYFLSSRDVVVSDIVQPVPASSIEPANSGTAPSRQTRQNALVEASSASAAPVPLRQTEPNSDNDAAAPAASAGPVRSVIEGGSDTADDSALTRPVTPSDAITERARAPQAANSAAFANAASVGQRLGPEGDTMIPEQSVVQSAAATLAVEVASRTEGSAVETTSRIKLIAREASWIQVRDLNTNELILSKVLLKGHVYEVPGRPGLGLMTGNAGALDVSVDGDHVPSLGKLGQTRQKIILNVDRLREGTAVEQ